MPGKDAVGSIGGTLGQGQITAINLLPGTAGINYNFGELLPGSLSGLVYLDANDEGIKETGEVGLSGITITLSGTDDRGAAVHASQLTAADGTYSFQNLRPGTYIITETPPATYLDGQDTIGSLGGVVSSEQFSAIVLNAGAGGQNYNFAEVLPGSLSGFVYVDFNNDGILDNGDARVGAVTITLSGTNDLSQSVFATQVSLNDGSYQFLGLRPGTYVLTLTQPSNYVPGRDSAGSLGGNVGNNQLFGIVLQPGLAGINYDFAELQPSSALAGASSGGGTGSGSFGKGWFLTSG
jgi:hypothetical protein